MPFNRQWLVDTLEIRWIAIIQLCVVHVLQNNDIFPFQHSYCSIRPCPDAGATTGQRTSYCNGPLYGAGDNYRGGIRLVTIFIHFIRRLDKITAVFLWKLIIGFLSTSWMDGARVVFLSNSFISNTYGSVLFIDTRIKWQGWLADVEI